MSYHYPQEVLNNPSLLPPGIQARKGPELTERLKKIYQAYVDAGLPYKKGIDDDREMRFEQIVRRRPDTLEEFVVWIFRVKMAKKKGAPEKIVYYRHRTALAFNDAVEEFSDLVGVWKKPISKEQKDVEGNTIKRKKSHDEYVFDIDFDPKKKSDRDKLQKIISDSKTEVTNFHLAYGAKSGETWVGNNNEQLTIHNLDDFINGDFDELWDMSKYGWSTSDPSLESWRVNQKEIKEAALMAKAKKIINN